MVWSSWQRSVRRSASRVPPGSALDPRTCRVQTAIDDEVASALSRLGRPWPFASVLALGLVFALLAHVQHDWTLQRCALLPLLIALALIMVLDLRSRIIPDVITLPGIAYALLLAASFRGTAGFVEAGLGALAGGAMVLLLAVVSRGGIGGGDIKLTAMLGAALGWKGALIAFALSQIAAGLVALILFIVRGWRQPMPVGALIALFGALMLVSRP